MSKILNDDFGTLAICAIRYCHGRQTYMECLKVVRIGLSVLSVKESYQKFVMVGGIIAPNAVLI